MTLKTIFDTSRIPSTSYIHIWSATHKTFSRFPFVLNSKYSVRFDACPGNTICMRCVFMSGACRYYEVILVDRRFNYAIEKVIIGTRISISTDISFVNINHKWMLKNF